ncbi:hypothetical protein [Methylomonas sp. AM2-LC]|uniref:hypothetical protein n=1 Tax=Methylomonas sp. AM2-LC TaxID=3153301 RepID=UPI0032647716
MKKIKNHLRLIGENTPTEQPNQMDLFCNLLCNNEDEREKLSNTIDVWDSISQYSIPVSEMNRLRTNNFLPSIEFDHIHKNQNYVIKISPALVEDDDGIERAYYPSSNEQLVEMVLRKIASENNGSGFIDTKNQLLGVYFTIYQIKQELKLRKKTRSHSEIIKSLKILSKSNIEISMANGNALTSSTYLPSLSAISKESYRTDIKARWVATFHPLVMQSINLLTYRQHDYDKFMRLKTDLSRWLQLRLSQNYTQASIGNPYKIKLSTIERDSKMIYVGGNYEKIRKVVRCLEELKTMNVIMGYTREDTVNSSRLITDILFTLEPHIDFIKVQKAANKRNIINLEIVNKTKHVMNLKSM